MRKGSQRKFEDVLRTDRAFATSARLASNRPDWLAPSLSEALAAAPESTLEKLRRGHALNEEEERALERELRRRARALPVRGTGGPRDAAAHKRERRAGSRLSLR